MPVLTSAGWVSKGFTVERRKAGKRGKWVFAGGPYCSREAAEASIVSHHGKHHITDAEMECRIKEVAV